MLCTRGFAPGRFTGALPVSSPSHLARMARREPNLEPFAVVICTRPETLTAQKCKVDSFNPYFFPFHHSCSFGGL